MDRSPAPRPAALSADAVEAYLSRHPRFLAERPTLYRRLAPPERVHGERLADHMAAMLQAERAHSAAMAERADFVLAAGRAAASLAARVQDAVLALIAANDAAACIADLPMTLAVDAASLLAEGDLPAARMLPRGEVARLLGRRAVLFRSGGSEAGLLHAEAAPLARHDALVRIPGSGPPALLALAARDAQTLDPAQGTAALAFLGRAMAAALGR